MNVRANYKQVFKMITKIRFYMMYLEIQLSVSLDKSKIRYLTFAFID